MPPAVRSHALRPLGLAAPMACHHAILNRDGILLQHLHKQSPRRHLARHPTGLVHQTTRPTDIVSTTTMQPLAQFPLEFNQNLNGSMRLTRVRELPAGLDPEFEPD